MNKQQTPNESLLSRVYKSVNMGSDAILTIIPKTDDTSLRSDLTAQLDGYRSFATQAKTKMTSLGIEPKETPAIAKMPAEMSIHMTTMVDNSNSKIAEMMIGGSMTGIIELTRESRTAGADGAAQDIVKLAQDVVTFEEGNIRKMRTYL